LIRRTPLTPLQVFSQNCFLPEPLGLIAPNPVKTTRRSIIDYLKNPFLFRFSKSYHTVFEPDTSKSIGLTIDLRNPVTAPSNNLKNTGLMLTYPD
jgi:hypothetical protein